MKSIARMLNWKFQCKSASWRFQATIIVSEDILLTDRDYDRCGTIENINNYYTILKLADARRMHIYIITPHTDGSRKKRIKMKNGG